MCCRVGRDGVAAMSSELGFLGLSGHACRKGARQLRVVQFGRQVAGGLAADAVVDAE
jgi:hypothetical protein